MMAVMMLVAAAGCRANNKKDDTPMTTPSAEVLPDNSAEDNVIVDDGENSGEIPEDGVDSDGDGTMNGTDGSGSSDQQNGTNGDMQNGTNGDAANTQQGNGTDAGTTAAPELVPSAGADQQNSSADANK